MLAEYDYARFWRAWNVPRVASACLATAPIGADGPELERGGARDRSREGHRGR